MSTRCGGTTAALLLALACTSGCTSARTRVTPPGDTVLARGSVEFLVPTHGFTIVESREGGALADPFVFATNDATGVVMSASLQAAAAGDCRELYWRNAQQTPNFAPEDVRQQVRGRFQVVEYTLRKALNPKFRDLNIDQRNAIGCVTHGAATAFLHVSKVKYAAQDEGLFTAAFEAARVDGD